MNKYLKILNITTLCRVQFLLPLTLLFYQKNGLNVGDFFLFHGIFSLLCIMFTIPSGYISDFFSKRDVLIVSYLMLLLKTILWIGCSGWFVILLGEILVGFSKTLYDCTLSSYMYEYLKQNNISEKMIGKCGLNGTCLSISTAIISLISGFIYIKYGFFILLLLDLFFISCSIILLCFLPKTKVVHNTCKINIAQKYKEILASIHLTMFNKKVNYYILLSGLFGTTTLILAYNFQPIMQFSKISAKVFGAVYFVNYLFRALSGVLVKHINKNINYDNIIKINFALFLLSLIMFVVSYIVDNKVLVLTTILLSCIAICFEVMFYYINVNNLHKNVYNKIRSACFSVNSTFAKIITSCVLISFKFLLKFYDIKFVLLMYIAVFITSFFIIKKSVN